jgi:hypothetical protein
MRLSCIFLFLFLATILGNGAACNAFAPLQSSSRNIVGSTIRTRARTTTRTPWPPVPTRAYTSQEPNDENNESDETETETIPINSSNKMMMEETAQKEKRPPIKSLDDFLDQPFWDPSTVDENDRSPIGWFARLVQQDYELAETLFVGAYFVILVIVTQEVLRFQLHGGDAYVPFTKVAGSGKLF